MSRFFLQASQIAGDTVTITGSDAGHISRVLRMMPGAQITVCDMQKQEYLCELVQVDATRVEAKILSVRQGNTEPPFTAFLYQALPKGDKMESVIQKSVESGVYAVVPMETERCVVRLDEKGRAHKQQRWQKIAESAAKQCGRGRIPSVAEPVSFASALTQASQADCKLFCYEGDGTLPLGKQLPEAPGTIAILIGPEGGFSQAEVRQAQDAGFVPVGLGNRILRTETAAPFVLACLTMRYELS